MATRATSTPDRRPSARSGREPHLDPLADLERATRSPPPSPRRCGGRPAPTARPGHGPRPVRREQPLGFAVRRADLAGAAARIATPLQPLKAASLATASASWPRRAASGSRSGLSGASMRDPYASSGASQGGGACDTTGLEFRPRGPLKAAKSLEGSDRRSAGSRPRKQCRSGAARPRRRRCSERGYLPRDEAPSQLREALRAPRPRERAEA